jgi:hypothetical protein
MAWAELGKNRTIDSVNVFEITYCPNSCPFNLGRDPRFFCPDHNGTATVLVRGGMTNGTLGEFQKVAPCLNPPKKAEDKKE